jgi:hypothetical protein
MLINEAKFRTNLHANFKKKRNLLEIRNSNDFKYDIQLV